MSVTLKSSILSRRYRECTFNRRSFIHTGLQPVSPTKICVRQYTSNLGLRDGETAVLSPGRMGAVITSADWITALVSLAYKKCSGPQLVDTAMRRNWMDVGAPEMFR